MECRTVKAEKTRLQELVVPGPAMHELKEPATQEKAAVMESMEVEKDIASPANENDAVMGSEETQGMMQTHVSKCCR